MHINMQDQRKSCNQGSYYMLCQSPALAKHAVISDIKSTLSSVVGLHSSVTKGPNRFSGQHNGSSRVWCLSAWANLSIPWPPPCTHTQPGACTRTCTLSHTLSLPPPALSLLHRFKYKNNTTVQLGHESKISVLNPSSHMQQFSLQNYHSKSVTKSQLFLLTVKIYR